MERGQERKDIHPTSLQPQVWYGHCAWKINGSRYGHENTPRCQAMIVRYGGSNARKIGDMGGLDAKGYSYVTEEVTHGRSVAWEDGLHN